MSILNIKTNLVLNILFLSFYSSCQSLPELKEPIKIEQRTIYGKAGESDKQEIEILFQKLVQATLDKNLESISDHIHPGLGIWVDLKAHWSKEEFIKTFQNKDNYFEIYFYSSPKLRIQKQNDTSWAVRDILILAKGIGIDYYFNASSDCELDLLFDANQELEGDLANPVFRKQGGKWYIYRLF